jgi:hypothetical protein
MSANALDELLAITRTGEFVDCGEIHIASAHWSDAGLTLRLEVDHGDEQYSSWQLQFERTLEHRLSDVVSYGLNVWHDDHPLIRQYTDPRQYLHFSSPPRNVDEVLGALWRAHVALVNDWIPFARFLNAEMKPSALLAGGNGLFATGPAYLIAAYAEVLDAQGCGITRLELARWRPPKNVVMAQLGASYVVAEELQVTPRERTGDPSSLRSSG